MVPILCKAESITSDDHAWVNYDSPAYADPVADRDPCSQTGGRAQHSSGSDHACGTHIDTRPERGVILDDALRPYPGAGVHLGAGADYGRRVYAPGIREIQDLKY